MAGNIPRLTELMTSTWRLPRPGSPAKGRLSWPGLSRSPHRWERVAR